MQISNAQHVDLKNCFRAHYWRPAGRMMWRWCTAGPPACCRCVGRCVAAEPVGENLQRPALRLLPGRRPAGRAGGLLARSISSPMHGMQKLHLVSGSRTVVRADADAGPVVNRMCIARNLLITLHYTLHQLISATSLLLVGTTCTIATTPCSGDNMHMHARTRWCAFLIRLSQLPVTRST